MSSQILKISEKAIISSLQGQLSSDLAGETVILNTDSDVYYGLNEVGARIWELVQQPRRFYEIHDILLAEYDVEPEICQHELTKIILDLKNVGLVRVSDEPE